MADKIPVSLIGSDPLPWLLDSAEPFTRLLAATELADSLDDVRVGAAHEEVLADVRVQALIAELQTGGDGDHESPTYLPSRLSLLADLGVRGGDDQRLEEQLDRLLEQQEADGRFRSLGTYAHRPRPERGSLLCDNNVITDVLLRFGRGRDERVQKALDRIRADSSATPQGRAWNCIPEKRTLFRGRRPDVCPQVTLEGLRACSHIPEPRPSWLIAAASTPLEVWRRRGNERPYGFGHGYQFRSVKWPNFWYDVLWMLETVTRFPELWRDASARDEDRLALAELGACLIAYNFDSNGRVTPRRTYRGFEMFSFGQKRLPSPYATARALVPLCRLHDLAEEIARVDVEKISSIGTASDRGSAKQLSVPCPVPGRTRAYPLTRAVPRVLARHHLGTPWQQASIESVVADIVGLNATSATSPYLSLWSRLPGLRKEQVQSSLYDRRSLVRLRCMRGSMFVVRRDLVPAAFNATHRQTSRYAREFGSLRGVNGEVFEEFAPRVLELLKETGALTTAEIRRHLGLESGARFDLATLVNLMTTEGLLLRDRPRGGWTDRQWTYLPFSDALPDVRLDSLAEETADLIIVRAYVRGFAPVTRKDVSWWTGIGPKRTQRALEELGDEIVEVALEGVDVPLLVHAADVDELESVAILEAPHVELLPPLDPFVMGFARREWYVPDEVREYVFDRVGNATSVVLAEGKVAGVWDAGPQNEPRILLHFFPNATAEIRERAMDRAERLCDFHYGQECRLGSADEMIPLPRRPVGAFMRPLRT